MDSKFYTRCLCRACVEVGGGEGVRRLSRFVTESEAVYVGLKQPVDKSGASS